MIQQMIDFIGSVFASPSVVGISLAVISGAICLALYRAPLFKKPWLWAVLAGSAVLMPIAMAFAEFPLKVWIWQAYTHFWSREVLSYWFLLINVPALLVNGLVKEGAKLVPVAVYWWRGGRKMTPEFGLAIGAVAGVAFGVLWAQWLYNSAFAGGWTWESVQTGGIMSLAPFSEGFFVVVFHTASCALAGYGLARGWGWQCYLLASLAHAVLNYIYLLQYWNFVSDFQAWMVVGAWAFLLMGITLWLRERKPASVTGT